MPPARSFALVRRAAVSAIAVFGSRVLGLVREQIFAFCFGASREYDAFLTAFRIPNLLRDLLAEGALSTAFVAVFSKELAANGKPRAFAVANRVMVTMAWVLAVVVVAGMAVAPGLVSAMAVGFDPEKARLTTTLTRAMFPFIFFVAMAALSMGMLNAQGYFAMPQSASSFFNVTSIVVGLGSAAFCAPEFMHGLLPWGSGAGSGTGLLPPDPAAAGRAMLGMAVGTLVGGLAQWGVQLPLLWRLGWRPWPRVALSDPALREVGRLLGPAILGAAAVQLSVFINSNFASLLGDRPISWLAYSFRLLQFPIGLFGVAIMSASLPTLSRQASTGDTAAFGETLTEALQLVLFFTIPAAIGLAVLATPIVRLLFEHGRFGATDTAACSAAVAAYAVGLPGYSALKIVQPAFVARGDARTPMYVTFVGIAASIGLNAIFLFVLHLGHVGLALCTSILATGSTCALLWLLETKQPSLQRAALITEASRIAVCAAVAGAVAYAGDREWQQLCGRTSPRTAAGELLIVGPAMVASYLAVAQVLGVSTSRRAVAALRRRRRS